ncbi:hypothetical protein G9A89_000663 [Geosiphon pyriformis]|nr:hypothetical protein G9A89_000663 [Geosiphon pyriformis]
MKMPSVQNYQPKETIVEEHGTGQINKTLSRQTTFIMEKNLPPHTLTAENFAEMDGLLAQYEAILVKERQEILQSQQKIQSHSPLSTSVSSTSSIISATTIASSHPSLSGYLRTDTRFWEFCIEDETTTQIRYGNILQDGTQKERAIQTQRHSSPLRAQEFVQRLIDEKLKAGYVGLMDW